jgi:hypothetical protein
MGFIADIFNAIVGLVVDIVNAIVQIVIEIIDFILELLGFEDQIIEYFDVQNILLFPDPDTQNPLLSSVLGSIIGGRNIATDLIYATVFRSLKGNVRKFISFIEDGDYFEDFPSIESLILIVDYDELDDVITTLEGVPVTLELSSLASLTNAVWVQYWLQENKTYDVGTNILTGLDFTTVTDFSTDDLVPAVSGFVLTPSEDNWALAITDEILTEDSMTPDDIWQVDLNSITHNPGPDTYTIEVFNDNGSTLVLPFTAPTKPLQLHYISYYYLDSNPSGQFLFIYQAGEGTHPTLDTVEDPIDIDGASLQGFPAIPLRISNSDYTTFGSTKAQQIEDILELVDVDAAAILDSILTDPDTNPGDIDNVYVNFGVRMRDTSQVGLAYLFTMFENLFPTQGTTQGLYDASPPGDVKPVNNIIIRTEDYEYVFQFNYVAFQFTTLAIIDADSGSDENGIYYSDATKFNDANELVYPYYSSSFKGTYNVGFKADTLAEVDLFLAGSGVVNPGITTGEATDWMQVTTRLKYTDPLNDPDGTASALLYLTPDMVYENNGGTLQLVNRAAEETTAGQIITYFYITEAGLEAYTVKAPTGAWKVVDGDSGVFNVIQFNLGAENDLMVPFIHTFIKDLSNKNVTQLFLAGAHVSIFIANYEVIELSFWAKLLLVVVIVIIVVITYYFPPAGEGAWTIVAGAYASGGVGLGAVFFYSLILVPILFEGLVFFAVQAIITEIAKSNEELALVLGVIAAVGFAYYSAGGKPLTGLDYLSITNSIVNTFNTIQSVKIQSLAEELEDARSVLEQEQLDDLSTLDRIQRGIFDGSTTGGFDQLGNISKRASLNPMFPSDYFTLYEAQITGQHLMYETGSMIDAQISPDHMFI